MDTSGDSAAGNTRLRSLGAKALVAYVVLACIGVGVLAGFVPEVFDLTELKWQRALTLIAVLLFVVGPVVAVGYFLLEALIESAVRGIGWLLKASIRAVARVASRLFRRAKE